MNRRLEEWLVDERESQETRLGERQELGLRPDLLENAMTHLNDRERHILTERRLRRNPTTLEDLSQQYGISRERVRQIEVRAFEKLHKAAAVADESELDASAEQRPAAYRFELRGTQIDVLPERPEAIDAELALDTYRELLAKAQALHGRLIQSNSARRVCGGVEMLLEALGTQFDDLRPGVLLSRERSIAADRAAFDTADGRGELFADAFAMLDDTTQTLRDLLAAFPIVRRIEAERLALDLDRNADAVPIIQEQMVAIEATAEKSDAVTEGTIVALTQNDAAIEDAIDLVVQSGLIADKLLVFRNFASAAIRGAASYGRGAIAKAGTEIAGVTGEVLKEVRARLPGAVGLAVTVAPLLLLADQISDPYLRIGAVVPAFTPVASVLKKAIADSLKHVLTSEAKNKPKRKKRGESR
jgi:hypothetical protein